MKLELVSETPTRADFRYDKGPAGTEGYIYFKDGVRVSRTFNPDDLTVTFGKPFRKVAVSAVGFQLLAQAEYPDAPPSGGPPAPVLSNPVQITIPSRGGTGDNGEHVLSLAAGKDYEVRFQDGVRYGPIWVIGNSARHMVLAENQRQVIEASSSAQYQAHRGWAIYDVQGTTRFPKYNLSGPGLSEGINYQCHNGTLQLVDVRVTDLRTMPNNPAQHPDAVQLWDSNIIDLYNVTVYTNYQGFWWSKSYAATQRYATRITMNRVNVRCLDNKPIVPFALLSPKTEYRLKDVYVEIPGRGLKDAMEIRESDDGGTIHPVPLWSWQEYHADGTPAGPVHPPAPYVGGAMNYAPLSDIRPAKQGDHILFPNATDRIFNIDVTQPGRVYAGVPAGGDYAP